MNADCVIDASALLAAILGEAGGPDIVHLLGASVMSAVNVTEVLTRLSDLGWPMDFAVNEVSKLVGQVAPFDEALAQAAARMRFATRQLGLSLGDRTCLALGMAKRLPVLTADRDWAKLGLGIEIHLVR